MLIISLKFIVFWRNLVKNVTVFSLIIYEGVYLLIKFSFSFLVLYFLLLVVEKAVQIPKMKVVDIIIMKAYINENNVVIAIGENDSLFPNCIAIEISEEQKVFIKSCGLPKYIDGAFVDVYVEVIDVPQEISRTHLDFQRTMKSYALSKYLLP